MKQVNFPTKIKVITHQSKEVIYLSQIYSIINLLNIKDKNISEKDTISNFDVLPKKESLMNTKVFINTV